MALEVVVWVVWSRIGGNLHSMLQLELHEVVREPGVP
jgi:hypothetical protein